VTHPIMVVQRICQQKGIQPIEMLAYLLERLQANHQAQTFTNIQPQPRNVLTEIATHMQLVRQEELPPSLLHTLDGMLRLQQNMDAHNSKVHRDAGRTADGDALQRRAAAQERYGS